MQLGVNLQILRWTPRATTSTFIRQRMKERLCWEGKMARQGKGFKKKMLQDGREVATQ